MILTLLLGCAPRLLGNRADDVALAPKDDVALAISPMMPRGFGNAQIAGLAFRNRPEVHARVKVAGPVEALETDGDRLFVLANGVPQMVRDGKVMWTALVRASTLSWAGGELWVGVDDEWVRLDVENGSVIARFSAGGAVRAPLRAQGSRVVWQTTDGRVWTQGGEIARLSSSSGAVCLDEDRVVASSLDGQVVEVGSWERRLPAAVIGGPVCWLDGAFLGVAGSDGSLGGVVRLDRSGVPVWWFRLATPPLPPAYGADGLGGWLVFAPGQDGALHALDIATGAVRWEGAITGSIQSLLVLDDAVLLGSSDGAVHALETADGGVRWRVETGLVGVPPVRIGASLWVGTAEGELVELTE